MNRRAITLGRPSRWVYLLPLAHLSACLISYVGLLLPSLHSVHKGDWDKSRGADGNHEYNRAWLAAAQRVLKPTTSTFETKSANSFRCSATSIFSNF
jgi:hypothetical protein